MRTAGAALVTLLALALPAGAVSSSAGVVWAGDVNSCTLGQWSQAQARPGGLVLVHKPVFDGDCAVRVTVRPGDDPVGTGGERAELLSYTNETEGTESWWGWAELFPRGFRPAPGSAWNGFTQWHGAGPHAGCPQIPASAAPLQFAVDTTGGQEQIVARVYGGANCAERTFPLGPLVRGRWQRFAVHVLWSADSSRGFLEVWRSGRRVVAKTMLATLYPGESVYLKQGYYRSPWSGTTILYLDHTRRGTSFADVR